MNLLKAKSCDKCIHSIIYGCYDNKVTKCNSLNSDTKKIFNENGIFGAAFCNEYKEVKKVRNGLINAEEAIRFILSGNSDFILHSTKTKEDFRFILKAERASYNQDKIIYFTNYIKGSENIYCGILYLDENTQEIKFSQGNKGKVSSDELCIRSLLFVINKLLNNKTVENLELYNVGKCGCCGKELIEEEDFSRGIHEKCIKHSMFDIEIKNLLKIDSSELPKSITEN